MLGEQTLDLTDDLRGLLALGCEPDRSAFDRDQPLILQETKCLRGAPAVACPFSELSLLLRTFLKQLQKDVGCEGSGEQLFGHGQSAVVSICRGFHCIISSLDSRKERGPSSQGALTGPRRRG